VSGNLVAEHSKKRIKNGPLLPEHIRALVCGSSGCGKTQLILNLLTQQNGIKFENVYVFSKTLFQPKYIALGEIMKELPEIAYFTFENAEDVLPPSEARENSVMIFDDIIMEEQSPMRSYFCFGRHKNIDVIYISQSYAKVSKHLIRENANLIILFKMDEMNLKHVYKNHCSSDVSIDNFFEMCRACWEQKFGFLVIDKESDMGKGKFRRGFDTFITL
jgi:hypothetical protein